MRVVCICCADLHFSQVAPAARSAEPDWFVAQKRYIDQIKHVQKTTGAPIIVAGDIFDRWNSPPELTNFLIDNFPQCYAIPGQHDLPNHRYEDRHRSAYGTLVRAGVVKELIPGNIPNLLPGLCVWAFPWGHPVVPAKRPEPYGGNDIHLAVVHSFIWCEGHGYPGAPEDQTVGSYAANFRGYDAVVFGDNHKGFSRNDGRLWNCGTLMRRKTDERAYVPRLGLVYEDGHIEPYNLDVSADLWLEDAAVEGKSPAADTSGFILSLKSLGSDSIDFRSAVNHRMEQQKVSDAVRSMVLEAVG